MKSQEMPSASSNQQFSVKTKGRSVVLGAPHRTQPKPKRSKTFSCPSLAQGEPSQEGTPDMPQLDGKTALSEACGVVRAHHISNFC